MQGPRPQLNWDGIAPRPFKLAIEPHVLDDLKDRLARTRWPDEIADIPWRHGTDLGYLKALCAYWHDGYDWRAQEAALNRFKYYKVTIGGIDVHYIHELGEGLRCIRARSSRRRAR